MSRKFTYQFLMRGLFTLFWVMLFQNFAVAQINNSSLIWDKAVGCIEYDFNDKDPKRGIEFTEDIEDAPCILVCEYNMVNYEVQGAGIANVSWDIAGGVIHNTYGNLNQYAQIEWGAPGNGAITVTITYTDNTVKTFQPCFKIINSPKAFFKINNISGDDRFCLETPINFDNLSTQNGGTDIVYYNWDFGDGQYSSASDPQHSYDAPGMYEVKLTVTNKCNCSDTYYLKIEIVDKPNVLISCPSVVCENYEKVRYTANDGCGNGEWKVEGGTIVNEDTYGIDVVWDNIDPAVGFGYVHYLSKCTCPFWTTVKVPVVTKKGIIQGNDVLCQGTQSRYSLPQWPTTEFNWYLVTDTNPSQVVMVDQRNEIIVKGLEPGNYTLVCEYKNTLLGCGGTAKKAITILPTVDIYGDTEFCSGAYHQYYNSSGNTVNWELKLGNNVVASNTSPVFEYPFPQGGTYVLTATPLNGCPSQPFIINVTQTPATPTGIIAGDTKICPGVPYEYSFTDPSSSTLLVWDVVGGTIEGDNTGETITVVFNPSGPYGVSVKRRTMNALGCESGSLNLNVTPLVVNATIVNNDGLTVFCPSTITQFTANLNGVIADHIEWEVSPSNFGNIIGGLNSPNVTVSWNEISNGISTGKLILYVTKCGIRTPFETTINLHKLPQINILDIGDVCPLDNTITVAVNTPGVTSGTLSFEFGNGNVVGPVNINSTGVYTISNGFSNNSSVNISQLLTVKLLNPNGCNYVPTSTISAVVFPETKIDISPGYGFVVCPQQNYSISLGSSISTGITGSVTFKWYKNNQPISGANTSSYLISNATQGLTPGGVYFVEVKDINGCIVKSNTIQVSESCGSTPGCTITPNPNPQMTWEWNCEFITSEVTYNGTPDEFIWSGGTHLTIESGQNTPNIVFKTSVPGAHILFVKLRYGNCIIEKSVVATKNYEPKLNMTTVCNPGSGTYNLTLHNNSTIFGININNITFTYTGPGITVPLQGQSAVVNNLLPGTYTYTLKLSSPGKPDCTVSETITLGQMPDVDFTLPGTLFCAEEAIMLTIPNYNPANQYRWGFDDTYYVASGMTTQINLAIENTYGITLEALTPQGCTIISAPKFLQIRKAAFSGNFSPNPISACEGTGMPSLSFVASGSANPSGYIWMKGNQQVGTGSSFTPSQSGSYWAVLIDNYGCKYNDMSLSPVNVTVRKRPFVNITGNTNICYGEQTTLQGVISNNTLERRWLINGIPMAAPHGNWSATTPLTVDVNSYTPGNYEYTLEVRPVTDVTCGNSQTFTVTVNPQPTIPVLTYDVEGCSPYKVVIKANGDSGTYNWSNGDSGTEIVVTNGGAYQVTYTAPTGCKVTAGIQVPHNVDRYMWVFPTGCFTICPFSNPAPYIIGPLGIFDSHQWYVNGTVIQGGSNMAVQNLPVSQAGTYQLVIKNDICTYKSDLMYVSPDMENCKVTPCRFKYALKDPIWSDDGTYHIYGSISNPYNVPMTVTISSLNGYGTFSPSSVTVPVGGTYNFNPLIFTPNAGFTGGQDQIILQVAGQQCMTLHKIYYKPYAMKMMDVETIETSLATMSVSPNPSVSIAVISYDLKEQYKQAQKLLVYNIHGVVLTSMDIKENKGEFILDVSSWSSGTYMIGLEADGKTVLQQKLIKK